MGGSFGLVLGNPVRDLQRALALSHRFTLTSSYPTRMAEAVLKQWVCSLALAHSLLSFRLVLFSRKERGHLGHTMTEANDRHSLRYGIKVDWEIPAGPPKLKRSSKPHFRRATSETFFTLSPDLCSSPYTRRGVYSYHHARCHHTRPWFRSVGPDNLHVERGN